MPRGQKPDVVAAVAAAAAADKDDADLDALHGIAIQENEALSGSREARERAEAEAEAAHFICGGCSGAGQATMKCSGCGTVRYCSKQCQLAHWPTHKARCRVLKAEAAVVAAEAEVEALQREEEEEQEEEEVVHNPDTEAGNCWNCGADNPRNMCNRCKVTKYCGVACQTENWPIHKGRCAALKVQYAAADRVKEKLKKYKTAVAVAERSQEELNVDLFNASLLGRVVDMERIIAAGGQVDVRGGQFVRPLYYAAQEGHFRAINVLVQHGAQINPRDQSGWEKNRNALHAAAQHGQLKAVATLLELGAQIDKTEDDGKSALFLASQNNHPEVVALLLKHGAQVDLTEGGRSGFMCRDNARTLALFQKCGLSTQNLTVEEQTSNICHIFANRPYLAGPYAEAGMKDRDFRLPEGENGCTPLIISSQIGHVAVVRLLLEHGAQINLRGNGGASSLYMASQNNHFEVVALLIEKGAHIDLPTKTAITPLGICAELGHTSVLELLLQHGANVDSCNDEGCSPLYLASQNNHPEIVALLLGKGAQVDLANKEGYTPLSISAQEGHAACVDLLLQAGADPLHPTNGGRFTKIALAAAIRNNHSEVVALLQARIAVGPPR